MSVCELQGLDLHPLIQKALRKALLVNFVDVLTLSETELIRETGLSENFARHLIAEVSKACLKTEIVSCDRLNSDQCPETHRRLKLTLCPSLKDGFLLTRTVTEITGASSSGKTQLCLKLAIQAQLPIPDGGLDADVAMICTEDAFPSPRFEQMVKHFKRNHPQHQNIDFGGRLAITHTMSLNHLFSCIQNTLPSMLKRSVKLLIIDSVTSIFRGEYLEGENSKRAADITKIGIALWHLAQEHGIAIVCVNQVSTATDAAVLVPALGMAWSHFITTRIMLARTTRSVTYGSMARTQLRSLKILFSSYLPNSTRYYIVHEDGVVFLKQSEFNFV